MDNLYKIIDKPIILSGGCGSLDHIKKFNNKYSNEAFAIASVLHYKLLEIKNIKKIINEKN